MIGSGSRKEGRGRARERTRIRESYRVAAKQILTDIVKGTSHSLERVGRMRQEKDFKRKHLWTQLRIVFLKETQLSGGKWKPWWEESRSS